MATAVSSQTWEGVGQGDQIPFIAPQNLQPSHIIPSDPKLNNQITFLHGDQAWPGLYPHWPQYHDSLQLLEGFVSDEAAAAAAVKSHQSCPTLCDPVDGSPSDKEGYVIGNEEEGTGLKLQPKCL